MIFKKIVLTGLQLAVAMLSCIAAAPSAFAQAKWEKLAPFPEPSEEILGAAAGGKMYVFAGLIPIWKPKGLVYEYDPANNQWTKKKPMALPSHHVAFTEYHGKIYAFGGFVYPTSGPAAWVPINNAWRSLCVCSPKLLAKIKRLDLNALRKQCKFIYITAEMRKSTWQLWFKQAPLSEPERANRISMESSMQAIEAAVNGLGIALIPELFIREDIAAKRLVIFPKQKIKSPSSFYLVFPELSLQKQKVRLFREWLLAQAEGG